MTRGIVPSVVIAFLLLASFGGCSWQSSLGGASVDEFTSYLETRVPQLIDQYEIPGANIALIYDGELVWSGAFGYSELEQKTQMRVDTVFRAESISKSVTAWGVMNLVEEGLIELDEPVSNYLEGWDFPPTNIDVESVTVRMLLSANSGLSLGTIGADAEYVPGSLGMPSLSEYLTGEVQFEQQPGESFLYSNVGFNLLELLIEEVSGQSFERYMSDEVLGPLGMKLSSYCWNEMNSLTMATGYDLEGQPVEAYVYPAGGAGGLMASVEDIALFVRAGMVGTNSEVHEVLSEDSINMLYMPQVSIPGIFGVVAESYGFGHFLETLPDGQRAVWHGGQGHGWMTHFHSIPAAGSGIVILTNSQRSWPFVSAILKDWSGWLGFGLVDFSKIYFAQFAMWALIGGVVLATLWKANKLRSRNTSGNCSHTKRLCGLGRLRALRIFASVGIIGFLIWSVNQPYLMLTAVFPTSAKWLGLACLGFAVLNFFSACCSHKDQFDGA